MAEENQHVQRKLWEHPDPKSSGMWKFKQEVNAKRGLDLQVCLSRSHSHPTSTIFIFPSISYTDRHVIDLLGPPQLLPSPGVILLGGCIRRGIVHPLGHLHQGG